MQETNYIFDFLVSRADPTLLFAVAVGDMQNNTNMVEFEYDYSTRGMAITKNILFILFVFPPFCFYLSLIPHLPSSTLFFYTWQILLWSLNVVCCKVKLSEGTCGFSAPLVMITLCCAKFSHQATRHAVFWISLITTSLTRVLYPRPPLLSLSLCLN